MQWTCNHKSEYQFIIATTYHLANCVTYDSWEADEDLGSMSKVFDKKCKEVREQHNCSS